MLFTFAGGNGHFEPLVPLARAAAAAGHTLAFACWRCKGTDQGQLAGAPRPGRP